MVVAGSVNDDELILFILLFRRGILDGVSKGGLKG